MLRAFLLALLLSGCAVLPWNWGSPPATSERGSDAPNAPDEAAVFTDPHTGEIWVRPSWLWTAGGLAVLGAAWRLRNYLTPESAIDLD